MSPTSTPKWASTCDPGCPSAPRVAAQQDQEEKKGNGGTGGGGCGTQRDRPRKSTGNGRAPASSWWHWEQPRLKRHPGWRKGGSRRMRGLRWRFSACLPPNTRCGSWIVERPWKYALSLYGLIDLVAILPFYLAWGTETTALRGDPVAAPRPAVEAQSVHPGVDTDWRERSGRVARRPRSSSSRAHLLEEGDTGGARFPAHVLMSRSPFDDGTLHVGCRSTHPETSCIVLWGMRDRVGNMRER